MLRSTNEITGRLTGYQVRATDGKVGHCSDLLFDDEHWAVRWVVVDTGGWLPGRKVLVSPICLSEPDWSNKVLPARFDKDRLARAPRLEEQAPVSRRYERALAEHFSVLPYWAGAGTWGAAAYPGLLWRPDREATQVLAGDVIEKETGNLRSAREVRGYRIHAEDDEVGHVEDFILDDEDWTLRYVVVDTRNWWPSKKVLVSPDWIADIAWPDQRVLVDLTKAQIENAPEYDPAQPVNRVLETRLYDYLGRPYYWRG